MPRPACGRSTWWARSLIAAAAAAAGCGGSGPSGVSASQACADLASARCNQRSMCSSLAAGGGPGASLVRVYGDLATCLEREALACRNGLGAPQTGNSPARVEACVAAYPTYSCQDFFDNNPPADCAVTGARPSAATCTFNGQCASGYCQGVKTSGCGACADPPAAGADCSASTCWHNQRCVAATATCQAVVSLNGACDGAHPCDNGLACVGATATAAGACQTAATTPGAACGAGMPACDNTLGLFCAGAAGAKTCAAITLVGAGMPCGTLADGTRADCRAGDCYTATGPANGATMGTCQAAVRETDADPRCDTALGPGCLPPARCLLTGAGTAGTCVVPTAALCPP
jgi:hypothetical protein